MGYVEMMNSKIVTLEVEMSDTILEVKAKLNKEVSIPLGEQHLRFGSQFLDDCCKLSDYKIQDGSTLRLIWRSRGGESLSSGEEANAGFPTYYEETRGMVSNADAEVARE